MFFVVSGLVMIILGDGSELASVQELDFESSKARCAAIRIIAISRCAEILCFDIYFTGTHSNKKQLGDFIVMNISMYLV